MKSFVLNALAGARCGATEDDAIRGLYHLRFSSRFASAFPQFAKEELRPRVTFDASVALDHEEVEFLAFGHPLVDALVERARSADYPARASHRIVLTDELEATRRLALPLCPRVRRHRTGQGAVRNLRRLRRHARRRARDLASPSGLRRQARRVGGPTYPFRSASESSRAAVEIADRERLLVSLHGRAS